MSTALTDTTIGEVLGFVARLPPGGTPGSVDPTDASGAPTGRVASNDGPNPVVTTKRRLEEWQRLQRCARLE